MAYDFGELAISSRVDSMGLFIHCGGSYRLPHNAALLLSHRAGRGAQSLTRACA